MGSDKFLAAYQEGRKRGDLTAPPFAEKYRSDTFDPVRDDPLTGLAHLLHDTYAPGIEASMIAFRFQVPTHYSLSERIGFRLGAFEAIRGN